MLTKPQAFLFTFLSKIKTFEDVEKVGLDQMKRTFEFEEF